MPAVNHAGWTLSLARIIGAPEGHARDVRACHLSARAAGAAPIRIGEPGYGPHLDRDGDGIACEPYRGR